MMNNKKTTKNKATKGRDITADIARKQGKKVSTELPNSYKKAQEKRINSEGIFQNEHLLRHTVPYMRLSDTP